MSTRTEVIGYGTQDVLASLPTITGVRITYTDSQGNHQGEVIAPGDQPTAVTLAPETYTAVAQAFGVDASGAEIAVGSPATDSFVLAAPTTVQVQVPVSLTGTTA